MLLTQSSSLDVIPIWVLFVLTVLGALLAVEAGFRLARYRKQSDVAEKETSVGGMVAAILGLLAFMLAFTFGMAASRFEERKRLVLDEANAVGTTYLRADLLPEPSRNVIRKLLKEYVDVRISGVTHLENLDDAIARSEALHDLLWSQAIGLGKQHPQSTTLALFIQSLNDAIDLHTKRLSAGLHNRIPPIIWMALYLLAAFAMIALGYHCWMSHSRRPVMVILLTVAFSIVIQLSVDLDRGGQGMIRVSQQAILDLQRHMPEPSTK